jgi:phage terminase large subunit-like protein
MVLNWETKELLLPEIFEWKDVQRIMRVAGERSFWKEYMLVCSDASNRLFSDEIIAKSTSVDYKLESLPKLNSLYMISADVATSGEASADFSAFIVSEIIKSDNGTKKIIRWIDHVKGMKVKDQIDRLQELSIRYNNSPVVVEKNNVGVALIQELQNRNVNVETFITTSQSKEGIIRYLVNEMTNGNLIIPFEGDNCIKLRNELANFGIKQTKSGNEKMQALVLHDDLIMALAINNFSCQMKNIGPSIALLY